MDQETLKILQSVIVAVMGALGYKFMLGGKKEDSHISDNKTITDLFNIQAKSIEEQNKMLNEQSRKLDNQSRIIEEQAKQIQDLTEQVLLLNTKLEVYERGGIST